MKKVFAGSRLKINSSSFNSMVDAANELKRTRFNGGVRSPSTNTKNGVVIVKNISGVNQEEFSAMQIDSILIDPATNLNEFKYRWALTVDIPSDDEARDIVILLEPIADDAIGEAVLLGAAPVSAVRPVGNTDDFCGTVDGETYLQCGNVGAAIIYESEYSADEEHLALVRIPCEAAPDNIEAQWANVASTTNLTLSGTQTIDGFSAGVNARVLAHNQSTSSQNGLYVVASGAWRKLSQPKSCVILSGDTGKRLTFILTGSNSYSPNMATWGT